MLALDWGIFPPPLSLLTQEGLFAASVGEGGGGWPFAQVLPAPGAETCQSMPL